MIVFIFLSIILCSVIIALTARKGEKIFHFFFTTNIIVLTFYLLSGLIIFLDIQSVLYLNDNVYFYTKAFIAIFYKIIAYIILPLDFVFFIYFIIKRYFIYNKKTKDTE